MARGTAFLVGAAIGSGTTALAAERGGADILLAINAGRLRNMGAPSIACMLPILDASTLTLEFARREILTRCRKPVFLGVNVWGADHDPAARAAEIRAAGFAGAVNFPSCMHYARPMQQILSRAGRGIEAEVAQLAAARAAGLETMFYCANRTQARLAADAGIDYICLNLGWNVGGSVGHRQRASLEEVALVAREVGRLVRRINPATRFVLEGGPIGTADDLARVISLADIDGYVGGSTIERIPLENSVANQIDGFRQAASRGPTRDAGQRRMINWARRFGLVGRSQVQLDFIARLRSLGATDDPLLLLMERGCEAGPAIAALLDAGDSGRPRRSIELDVTAEDTPGVARNRLFAQDAGGRPPLLSDERIGMVVIRGAERFPPATQARLARSLRERRFRITNTRRMGTLENRVVVVCECPHPGSGTAQTLAAAGMTNDLVDAFAGRILRMPPLRERIDDLVALVEHHSPACAGRALGRSSFSADAIRHLSAHRWPGNEAELRRLLGTLVGRESDDPLRREDLPLDVGSGEVSPDHAAGSERERIVDALWRNGFSRTRTAAYLGISRKTLYNKIRRYGLAG